jgi:magnesium transporter
MDQAVLFDRDRAEKVDDWEALVGRLGRKSLLWIDFPRPDQHEIDDLAKSLELAEESRERLAADDDGPYFGDFGNYLHVRAYAPSAKGSPNLCAIDCLVSEHWLVTAHAQDAEVIDNFRERAADGSGETGKLDGLEFLATMLEWVLHEYLVAFDRIEDDLAEIEAGLLESPSPDPDRCLRQLVTLRREIRDLRAALVSHREVFLALTRPELKAIGDSRHAQRFASLRSRLDDTIQNARDCRDSVVGSFDVLHARTEQRTNEIMKVLTLGSMLFLPGALVAGVLGMNFRLGFFAYDVLFWVVLAAIFAMMGAVFVAARLREWI